MGNSSPRKCSGFVFAKSPQQGVISGSAEIGISKASQSSWSHCDDGLVGQQLFAGEATRLAYGTKEAKEGKDAFLEKRKPDWSDFPWHF
jgi:hypothetical protein